MILPKKGQSYENFNTKSSSTASKKCADRFRVDTFMAFAKLYKGFLKWP